MRYVICIVLAGCAVSRPPLAATNPANPAAPTGRLAGAPATLRADAVKYDLPARKEVPAEQHQHHGH
jgi:hypothetical protein